eukprot:COSAG02_NODE_33483_length_499_cov_0.980000_2_plen_53_part_01
MLPRTSALLSEMTNVTSAVSSSSSSEATLAAAHVPCFTDSAAAIPPAHQVHPR